MSKVRESNVRENNIKDVSPRLRLKLNNFLTSLSDVLIDITAVEVNTMVVDHISGNKFIPWEAYREIYQISQSYLERMAIHPSLHASYLNLRKKVEMEYCLFLLKDEIASHQDSRLREYYESLSDGKAEVDDENTKMPNPLNPSANPAIEIAKIQSILEDGRFLRSLRKINELKVALDNRSQAIKNINAEFAEELGKASIEEVTTDLIYAQTIIQLDGDIINRYHQKLLQHPQKDLILEIHRQGVVSGEKQWHGLVEFVVNFLESILNKNIWNKDLFNRN